VDGAAYLTLEYQGRLLEDLLQDLRGLRVQRFGSLFWLVLDEASSHEPIRTPAGLSARAVARFPPYFHALLAAGFYLPPSPYEVGFLSTAHTGEDLRAFASATRAALASLAGS
jgi:glutamate-1-semialdehyde 2,1-aminomutase